jgi:ABC-type transport system substrate-binding protein
LSTNNGFESRWDYKNKLDFIGLFPLYSDNWPAIGPPFHETHMPRTRTLPADQIGDVRVDPDTTDQFACANVPPHGYNKSHFCDPAIDALLARGRTTFDPAIRKAIYAQLQARLYAALPIALLYQGRQLNTFTTRLHNESGSLSSPFWNAAAWTLSPSPR